MSDLSSFQAFPYKLFCSAFGHQVANGLWSIGALFEGVVEEIDAASLHEEFLLALEHCSPLWSLQGDKWTQPRPMQVKV